jgi:hypothetical protein
MSSRAAAAKAAAASRKTTPAGKSSAPTASATPPTASKDKSAPAPTGPAEDERDHDNDNDENENPVRFIRLLCVLDSLIGYCYARAFIFPLYRGHDCLHPIKTAAVIVARLEAWRDLLVNDAFANRIRQRAFQSVPDLDEHRVVLCKNEKHHAVVLRFLAHLPRPRYTHSIILDGRIRLHFRINDNEDLVGALPLKTFERGV